MLRYHRDRPVQVSAELLLGSIEAAAEVAIDLKPVLQSVGLSVGQLQTGNGKLSLHVVVEFLNELAELAGDDIFALRIAKHQPGNRFAAVSKLIKFAPTLNVAINDAIQFSLLNSEYSDWALHCEDDCALLTRYTRFAYHGALVQMQTLALAVVYKAMLEVCRPAPRLVQVQFTHARPNKVESLERFFSAPILFNQPRNTLVFNASDLALPLPGADEQIYAVMRGHLEQLAQDYQHPTSVDQAVRHLIKRTLGSGQCHLNAISALLSLHPRTLQRQLSARATSFAQLLNDARIELACDYLLNSSIGLSELSDILGYANVSALVRAFSQQTGMPPRRWQQIHKDHEKNAAV